MLLQKILNGGAGVGAQFLDTDNDGFLSISFHIQSSPDADQVFVFFVAIHHYLNTVRDLLLILQKDLLADEFRHEEAHRAVGEGVFREVGWAFGQQLDDAVAHGLDVDSF